MSESYDKYSDEELITEVKEYYPELLEEWSSVPVGQPAHIFGTAPKMPYISFIGGGRTSHTT
jgi:hypothetical protein